MTPTFTRPVPRWLRVWSILTVIVAAAVIVLGSLITTFKVGMSDPVWPTEPWFLIVNNHVWVEEPARGFLIEHTHRLVAWAIGVFATVLAVGAWIAEPDRKMRWIGTTAILFLLVAYLGLHGEMGSAWRARKAGGELVWPVGSAIACGVGVFVMGVVSAMMLRRPNSVICSLPVCGEGWGGVEGSTPLNPPASGGRPEGKASGVRPESGSAVRLFATLGLVAVMIQGLLGGYRVFLDQLMGTQLAAIHGSFGQVTFAVLMGVAVLTAPRRDGDCLPEAERAKLQNLGVLLPILVTCQLIWGVWVRHMGSPIAQRLHILTAFVVTGLCVWLCVRTIATEASRKQLGFYVYHLLAIIAVQIVLGVEAWMGKFAASGPSAMLPPELRPITEYAATVRTFHTLIGAALLASTVVLAIRILRKPVPLNQAGDKEPSRVAPSKTTQTKRELIAAS